MDFEKLQTGIDSLLEKHKQSRLFSGYVYITHGGNTVYSKGNGYENREKEIAFTENTRFCPASVSKIFTASAVLLLQQQGKLDLHDPVMQYVPELKMYPEITVHHLVHHISGLPVSSWKERKKVKPKGDTLKMEEYYAYIQKENRELKIKPNYFRKYRKNISEVVFLL